MYFIQTLYYFLKLVHSYVMFNVGLQLDAVCLSVCLLFCTNNKSNTKKVILEHAVFWEIIFCCGFCCYICMSAVHVVITNGLVSSIFLNRDMRVLLVIVRIPL